MNEFVMCIAIAFSLAASAEVFLICKKRVGVAVGIVGAYALSAMGAYLVVVGG